MTVTPHEVAGLGPRYGEQGVGFRSSFDGAWLDPAWAVAHPLLGNEAKQPQDAGFEILVGADLGAPAPPDLKGVLEADLFG